MALGVASSDRRNKHEDWNSPLCLPEQDRRVVVISPTLQPSWCRSDGPEPPTRACWTVRWAVLFLQPPRAGLSLPQMQAESRMPECGTTTTTSDITKHPCQQTSKQPSVNCVILISDSDRSICTPWPLPPCPALGESHDRRAKTLVKSQNNKIQDVRNAARISVKPPLPFGNSRAEAFAFAQGGKPPAAHGRCLSRRHAGRDVTLSLPPPLPG